MSAVLRCACCRGCCLRRRTPTSLRPAPLPEQQLDQRQHLLVSQVRRGTRRLFRGGPGRVTPRCCALTGRTAGVRCTHPRGAGLSQVQSWVSMWVKGFRPLWLHGVPERACLDVGSPPGLGSSSHLATDSTGRQRHLPGPPRSSGGTAHGPRLVVGQLAWAPADPGGRACGSFARLDDSRGWEEPRDRGPQQRCGGGPGAPPGRPAPRAERRAGQSGVR